MSRLSASAGRVRHDPRVSDDPRTIVFFPEGRLRPDQQLRRDRPGAARPRPSGRVHRRGVVRRHARGQGLRGTADAARSAARGRARGRPASSGSTSSATPRRSSASRTIEQLERVHRPDLAGARSTARSTSTRASPRSSTSSRRTRSSRTTSSRSRRSRRPAGRGSGSSRATRPRSRTRSSPPFSSGLPGRRPARLAGVPGRGRADASRHVGRLRRVLPRARRAGPALRVRSVPTSSPSRRTSTCTSYPAEADYARERPARPDLASPRFDGPGRRDHLGAARRTCASATAR